MKILKEILVDSHKNLENFVLFTKMAFPRGVNFFQRNLNFQTIKNG